MKTLRDTVYVLIKIPFILIGMVSAFVYACVLRGWTLMGIIANNMENKNTEEK